jgi:catechol 2,3-dioxygenase-like lactoylglutathione lyase family enzyme
MRMAEIGKIELSRRNGPQMNRSAISVCLIAMWLLPCGTMGKEVKRPRILGIQSVSFYSSNPQRARPFYALLSGSSGECEGCPTPAFSYFPLISGQSIQIKPVDKQMGASFFSVITFETDDVIRMKNYLNSQHVDLEEVRSDGALKVIRLADPEGHRIAFAHSSPLMVPMSNKVPNSVPSKRLIHAGFVVKDRAAMDKFYKDILGFRLYWHGGMTDDQTQWVDMQVPDGTDWIEYMLNVRADADKHTLGVMNHIALGVPDVKAAAKALEANGVKLTEQPKIGRDGKWQLNLYDPDQTRVELMEFTPVEKPCCAEYTGPHPKP